ncbi:putative translation initiation factor [Wilcoxina mikolae CBS 423.85]|nr:putative translation initiation factor [Wilcoxina mikolae CBS 423.85]
MALQAIQYTRSTLNILNQLELPHSSIYVPIKDCEDAYDAIKRMVVRGAPAIAIVAALALAVELENSNSRALPVVKARAIISERLDYLVTSRPTAVNLSDAATKLKAVVADITEDGNQVVERYIQAAEKMLVDDVADNKNIGDFGAQWILDNAGGEQKVAVLTHCNTGSLATAGYGTALGIIRSLHAKSSLRHAYCTETRPYNQGSRLTAYELAHDIPSGMSTLITDSMAASLMNLKGISAIVVGADRVALNGDTANKIGTYQLAIVARYHGVKFVVAAPTTSIDINAKSGADIVIEERPSNEVLVVTGPAVSIYGDRLFVDADRVTSIAPGVTRGVGVYNPSFDVTPKDLIDVIVTEKGAVAKNENNEFDLARLFA